MTNSNTAKTNRKSTQHTFTASDNTQLAYHTWPPTTPQTDTNNKTIILFHRGHEHAARWQDLIDRINLPEFTFFAWDARGHGNSPGQRGYAKDFARIVKDADEFVNHVTTQNKINIQDVAVISQSVGSVIAATWVHDYAPNIRALTLATPAFRIKLYAPFAIPTLKLFNKIKPKTFIKSYVRPTMLTHDKEQSDIYANDKLISPKIATNILLDLHDTSTRIIQDAGAIHTPVQLHISGNDYVVKQKPQHQFFDNLSSTIKEKHEYPTFKHSTFWEKDRQQPIDKTRAFILKQFETPVQTPSLLNEHKQGYSKDICNTIEKPLSPISPKALNFKTQLLSLKTIGKLSRGIRIGWATGFDSGQSLDHVYRNTPQGRTPLGKLIDYSYLNTPGWKGIRQRKVHMQTLLEQAIKQTAKHTQDIKILDIAAGPGRYLLETIKNHPKHKISATLCDRDQGGLDEGIALAKELNINTATYKQSDAFAPNAITQNKTNIAIVSGLYELFPDNQPIQDSLKGLAQALPQHGYLLYTNQPWHPQQEMIARVLPNRDGLPWIMRCRTQAEMDQLVENAGFKKINMLIDNQGIFSVSLAIKI